MFHVSRGCSPTIANVEAAQFERSCTKQLNNHQSGSNAQVPLLDHVSVSHTAVQPFNPQGTDMAPRPVGPSPADRLCTCKGCSRLLTGHGSKGLGLELEIEPSRPRAGAGDLHRASDGHQEGRVKRQPKGSCTSPSWCLSPCTTLEGDGEFRTHPRFILEWNSTITSSTPAGTGQLSPEAW